MSPKRQELDLQNDSKHPVTLHLEPWGEQFVMPANSSFELVAQGPDSGHRLKIVFEDKNITLYAWPGSTVAVYKDGKQLDSGASEMPSPATPKQPMP